MLCRIEINGDSREIRLSYASIFAINEALGLTMISEYRQIFKDIAEKKDVNLEKLLNILWVCYNNSGEFIEFDEFVEKLDINKYSIDDLVNILFNAYEKSIKKKKTILERLKKK